MKLFQGNLCAHDDHKLFPAYLLNHVKSVTGLELCFLIIGIEPLPVWLRNCISCSPSTFHGSLVVHYTPWHWCNYSSSFMCSWYSTSRCTACFIILSRSHVIALLCPTSLSYNHATLVRPLSSSRGHEDQKLLAVITWLATSNPFQTCPPWETIFLTVQVKLA
jgi:hypothetical protein